MGPGALTGHCSISPSQTSFAVPTSLLPHTLFFFLRLFLFYFWLCWIFVAARGLSLVAGSRSSSLVLNCGGFELWWLLLGSTGPKHVGSVVVAYGLGCSMACETFPDEGWKPCPLHCKADSQPLDPQGSPLPTL